MTKKEYLDILFLKPQRFEEVVKYIEYITNGTIIHLNCEELDGKTSQRVIDFINGAVYIVEGIIVNPSTNIYCFVPKGKEYSVEYRSSSEDILDSSNDEEEEIRPTFKR